MNIKKEEIKVDDYDDTFIEKEKADAKTPDEVEEQASKEATLSAILDAVKELTKVTGELKAEWAKWRVAGKF